MYIHRKSKCVSKGGWKLNNTYLYNLSFSLKVSIFESNAISNLPRKRKNIYILEEHLNSFQNSVQTNFAY